MLASPLPHVPGVVDELVPHLHLCILEPELDMLEINIYGALEYRTCSRYLLDTGLPLGVLNPVAHVMPLPPDSFFEVTAHSVLVLIELGLILHAVTGCLVLILSVGLRLSQKLFSSDLDLGWSIVLDLSDSHRSQTR